MVASEEDHCIPYVCPAFMTRLCFLWVVLNVGQMGYGMIERWYVFFVVWIVAVWIMLRFDRDGDACCVATHVC